MNAPAPNLPPTFAPTHRPSITRHSLWGLDLAVVIASVVAQVMFWVPVFAMIDRTDAPAIGAVLSFVGGIAIGATAIGAWLVRSMVLLANRVVSVWYVIAPVVAIAGSTIAVTSAVALTSVG